MFKILFSTLILLAGCIPSTNVIVNDDKCSATEQFNAVTRQCETLVNQVPIGTLTSKVIYEDSGANIVTLTYYDADNEPATACEVLTYGIGINLFPPTACTCTSGICSVPVTPNADWNGSTFFTYRILDSNGFSEVESVGVTVVSINDTPVPVTLTATVSENGLLNDQIPTASDRDPDILGYSILNQPLHGEIKNFNWSTGSFTYDPYDDDTSHSTQQEILTYQVCDNGSPIKCATSTITIEVWPSNDAPTVSGGSFSVANAVEDTAIMFTVPVATDREGDTILYLIENGPTYGTLTACLDTDGVTSGLRTCTYTPDPNFDGIEIFTYKVCDDYPIDGFADNCSTSVESSYVVMIDVESVNDAPVAFNSTLGTNEDTALVANLTADDVDDDNSSLTYSIITHPSTASVSLSGSQFSFTPGADENSASLGGDESFTFVACDDENVCSSPGTITISIAQVEDPPTITLPGEYTGSLPTVSMNEGGSFNLLGIKLDEGGALDEDGQELDVAVVVRDYSGSDYTQILPANDPDSFTHLKALYGTATVTNGNPVGAQPYPFGEWYYVDIQDGINSGDDKKFDLIMTPVAGQSGTIEVEIFLRERVGLTVTATTSRKFLFSVNAVTALHGGWNRVRSVGVNRDRDGNIVSVKRDQDGNSSIDSVTGDFYKRDYPQIELGWNEFTLASSDSSQVSVSSWEIFRRGADEEYDWDNPIATISDPNQREYFDPLDNESDEANPVAGTVYFYTVRPVASTNGLPVPTQEVFSEIRVIAPPDNMAFVHRWMANQEICGKMKKTMTNGLVDPTANFRCEFTGPGETGGYYDIGADLLVDINEAGCPYDYIGKGDPASQGITSPNSGELYYDRSTALCYRFNGGWSEIASYVDDDLSASKANLTRSAWQAPLVNILAQDAALICQDRTPVTVVEGSNNFNVSSYLPSRKFQIAYSSWSTSLTDAQISEIEEGAALGNSSKCNSSQADGIDGGFSDVSSIDPDDNHYYAVTGTQSSGIRSVYTGSDQFGANGFTYKCVSRYGVQDVYGNVSEWVSDQMDCWTDQYECTSETRVQNTLSTIIPSDDWGSYSNTQGLASDGPGHGSCVDSNSDNSCDGYLEGWYIYNKSNNSTRFSMPLGLTYSGNYSEIGSEADYLAIGSSAGITTNELHSDYVNYNMIYNYNSQNDSSIATGGSYLTGDKSGRYYMELSPNTDAKATLEVGDMVVTVDSAGSHGNDYYLEIIDDGSVALGGLVQASFVGNKITAKINSMAVFGSTYGDVASAIDGLSEFTATASVAGTGASNTGSPADGQIEFLSNEPGVDSDNIIIDLIDDVAGAVTVAGLEVGASYYVEVDIEDGVTTDTELRTALDAFNFAGLSPLITTTTVSATTTVSVQTVNLTGGTGSAVAQEGTYYFSGGFDSKRADVGFRCVVPVPSGNFNDTNHSYPYDP